MSAKFMRMWINAGPPHMFTGRRRYSEVLLLMAGWRGWRRGFYASLWRRTPGDGTTVMAGFDGFRPYLRITRDEAAS